MASVEKKKKETAYNKRKDDNRNTRRVSGKPLNSIGPSITVTVTELVSNNKRVGIPVSLNGRPLVGRIKRNNQLSGGNIPMVGIMRKDGIVEFAPIEVNVQGDDPVLAAMKESKRLLKTSPVINFDKVRFE